MAWTTPQYSKNKINESGKILVDPNTSAEAMHQALEVINNWRACHYYPMHAVYITLKRKATSIDSKSLTSRRLKRLSSIKLKLQIQKNMKLSQMQDIGGCRAIVKDIEKAKELVNLYQNMFVSRRFKHVLEPNDDYIACPKKSGYRGVHMIVRFRSDGEYDVYNGQRIEVQIRSQLQHAWATTVEIVGFLIKQALKSSLGDDAWKRFFALMGSVIAVRENAPLVPGTPTN